MRKLWAITIGIMILSWSSRAEPPRPAEFGPATMKSLVKPVGPGLFEIGKVRIDQNTRQISFPTKVNLRDVLIEYAIVGKIGKLHESLLTTDVSPTHIHIAMLLLGTKDMRPKSEEKHLPPGQPIDILINWEHEGLSKKGRIEDWIIVEKDKKSISQGMWVYSGARIDNGYFTANTDESIVAIILDIDALANNPRTGNENDEIWFPNESEIPPLGTDVMVTFKFLDSYATSSRAEEEGKQATPDVDQQPKRSSKKTS
ncbi:YdjY domain-containing protein [bacterium]|jgi:hypothetical protein|nr:YdjY domain-containing protein [bacterium]